MPLPRPDDVSIDNGDRLRAVIAASGLTQVQALARFNHRQARPITLRSLKGYCARKSTDSRVICTDAVLRRFARVCDVKLQDIDAQLLATRV